MSQTDWQWVNANLQQVVDAVYRTIPPERSWLYELSAQNFMDGLAPSFTEVRVVPGEVFFGAYDAFVIHHTYRMEFRESGVLRGQIVATFGVRFDLQNKYLEDLDYWTSEATTTDEFLSAYPRSATYHHTWPLMQEIVPSIIQQMDWPKIVLPEDLTDFDPPFTTWLYDSDLAERGGTW